MPRIVQLRQTLVSLFSEYLQICSHLQHIFAQIDENNNSFYNLNTVLFVQMCKFWRLLPMCLFNAQSLLSLKSVLNLISFSEEIHCFEKFIQVFLCVCGIGS